MLISAGMRSVMTHKGESHTKTLQGVIKAKNINLIMSDLEALQIWGGYAPPQPPALFRLQLPAPHQNENASGGVKAKQTKLIMSDSEALQMGGLPPHQPPLCLDCKLPAPHGNENASGGG